MKSSKWNVHSIRKPQLKAIGKICEKSQMWAIYTICLNLPIMANEINGKWAQFMVLQYAELKRWVIQIK